MSNTFILLHLSYCTNTDFIKVTKEVDDNLQKFTDPANGMKNLKQTFPERLDKQTMEGFCGYKVCPKHFSIYSKPYLRVYKPHPDF
jgi:hypothetical protein